MRRDGFASLRAGNGGGTLTTRPLHFNGSQLFVNVATGNAGELRADVLDAQGAVAGKCSADACEPVRADSTIARVRWTGVTDLSRFAGMPVRFRFHLRDAALYSFWVSPNEGGASRGYVAAGGPGFIGPTDTVGLAGYR